MNAAPHLAKFLPAHAAEIVGWVATPEEARAWCGHGTADLPRPAVFEAWHRDPDVHAHVLLRDGSPVAYGEAWVDRDEREIELARLIVRPADRGRGVGRLLVRELLREAARFGYEWAFVRVLPGNAAALACYRGAGFTRVPEAEERRFTAPQPTRYLWLRRRVRG